MTLCRLSDRSVLPTDGYSRWNPVGYDLMIVGQMNESDMCLLDVLKSWRTP